MSSLENDAAYATDMTLVLGAESYILKQKQRLSPADPLGKDCLQTFVDLFLNTERMYFTLPGTQDEGTPILIQRLGSHLSKFSKSAIHLSEETEQKVFEGFTTLIESNDKELLHILGGWLNFQMLNPIVTKGHRYRVHAKGERLIPDDSYQIWADKREQLLQGKQTLLRSSLVNSARKLAHEIDEYAQIERNRFDSLEEFLVCYFFDNYRRGCHPELCVKKSLPQEEGSRE
ncbi:MAG TPA: hypothetical protein VFB60_11145 [Ktedonobacteraceae bacterium]|nr:hypothetical protein [Ktedonobacteraceae bacterium]